MISLNAIVNTANRKLVSVTSKINERLSDISRDRNLSSFISWAKPRNEIWEIVVVKPLYPLKKQK